MEIEEGSGPSRLSELSIFLSSVAILSIVGIVMVYSSSYLLARDLYGVPAYFFTRQLMFIGISIATAFVVSKTRFTLWLRYAYAVNILMAVILALTFIPGIGLTVKGASRWIAFAGYSFQPGEIAKYTTILSALVYFENYQKYFPSQRIVYASIILAPLALILSQPDYGSFMICAISIFFICYMSTFPRKIFYGMIPVGAVSAMALLIAQPYRVERLKTFLDPWQSPQGSGFQIIQSWMGFANGSLFGKGLGNSYEKLFYLPEAHNDFILSVIGEELGFVGVTFLVILFMSFIYYGFKLSLKIERREASLLAAGVVYTIGIQALLNMAVVLGLLPTKGLNLPFISYGGSSLVANFFAIGLFLSAVAKRSDDKVSENTFAVDKENDLNDRLKRFREQRNYWSSQDDKRVGQSSVSGL
jgi:cell division protein FtsW